MSTIGLHDDYAFLIPMAEESYCCSASLRRMDVVPDTSTLKLNDDDVSRAFTILRKWFPNKEPRVESVRVFCDCYQRMASRSQFHIATTAASPLSGADRAMDFASHLQLLKMDWTYYHKEHRKYSSHTKQRSK